MRTRIRKWGNSLALRIPQAFAKEVRVEHGSEVDLSLVEGKLIIAPLPEVPTTLAELLEGITDSNLHGEVDSGPAVGEEAW